MSSRTKAMMRLKRACGCPLVGLLLATLAAAAPPGRAAKQPKSLDEALLEDLDAGLDQPAARTERPAKKTAPSPDDMPSPGPQEPPKRSLDDDLLDGLEGEDVSLGKKPANENPLLRINQRMKQSERRIAETHSDETTQRLQAEIADDLTKLIAQLERQCRQQKSSAPQARPKQSKGSSASNKPSEQAGENPARESTPHTTERATAKVDRAKAAQMLKDAWGHLPPHLRQQMEQSANEEFLPKYESDISEYYRSLIGARKERE